MDTNLQLPILPLHIYIFYFFKLILFLYSFIFGRVGSAKVASATSLFIAMHEFLVAEASLLLRILLLLRNMGSVAVVHVAQLAYGTFLGQGLNPCHPHWKVDS